MSRMRAGLWSLSLGVLAALLASILVQWLPLPLPVLALSVAIVASAACMAAEIPAEVGALGGVAATLVAAGVLAATISAAPLAPDAHRPELRDLFWKPLFLFLAVAACCALSGWMSARLTLRVMRPR
jgi:hypothetical protein